MPAQADTSIWLPSKTNMLVNELLSSKTEIKASWPSSSALLSANLRLAMRNAASVTLSFMSENALLEVLRPLSIEVAVSNESVSRNLKRGKRDIAGEYDSSQCKIYVYSTDNLVSTIGHEFGHHLKKTHAPEPYEGAGVAYAEGIAGLHGAACSAELLHGDMIARGVYMLCALSKYPSHGESPLSFLSEFESLRTMFRPDSEKRLRSLLRGGERHNHDFYDHERGYKFAALNLLAHGLDPISTLRYMLYAKSEEAINQFAAQQSGDEFALGELRRRLTPRWNGGSFAQGNGR